MSEQWNIGMGRLILPETLDRVDESVSKIEYVSSLTSRTLGTMGGVVRSMFNLLVVLSDNPERLILSSSIKPPVKPLEKPSPPSTPPPPTVLAIPGQRVWGTQEPAEEIDNQDVLFNRLASNVATIKWAARTEISFTTPGISNLQLEIVLKCQPTKWVNWIKELIGKMTESNRITKLLRSCKTSILLGLIPVCHVVYLLLRNENAVTLDKMRNSVFTTNWRTLVLTIKAINTTNTSLQVWGD